MAVEQKRRINWRRLVGFACLLVFAAVLVIFIIAIFSADGSGLSGFFSRRLPEEPLSEYQFDVGRGRVFADFGDSVAAAGTLGIQVLDNLGNETLREPFRMSSPALDVCEGRAVAFDIGGVDVRVFSSSEVFAAFEAEGAVISASINENGWFCVCTQAGGGFKGIVTVYNNRGVSVYRASLESGYVLSAALSPDNRYLAVLNLPDDGSRITFYRLNSPELDSAFDLPGGLIIDIRYVPGGDLIAVSTGAVTVVDRYGEGRALYGFSGSILSGYAIGADFIALHLLDYGVGYSGSIVTFSDDGGLLGEIAMDREVISMSIGGGYLAMLRNDGLVFYNAVLDEFQPYGRSASLAGASRVLALDNGAALAAGDHSAVVFRVEANNS